MLLSPMHKQELRYAIHPVKQIAVLFALTIILTLCLGLFAPLLSEHQHFLQSLSQILIFGISSVVFAIWFYKTPLRFLQLDIRPLQHKAQWFLWVIIIMFIATPIVDFITQWNENLHLPEAWSAWENAMRDADAKSQTYLTSLLEAKTISKLFLNLFVVAMLPALCEELFFRGVLQQILQRWIKNIHIAIWITGLIFSLFHLQLLGFFPRWLLGIVLGYLFAFSHTIWIPIIAHFINNAILVIFHYLYSIQVLSVQPDEISFSSSTPIVIVSAVATLFILIQCYFLHTSNTEQQ